MFFHISYGLERSCCYSHGLIIKTCIEYQVKECKKFKNFKFSRKLLDGKLSHHMNTRVPSEPRYELRKRNHSQQNGILLLIHNFEKLTIHEMKEEDLSKTLKESVDPKGIIFPPPPIIY